jgi:hypothetical protein
MSWLIDNANIWYVLFGMVALGFGTVFWLQRRPKYLLGVLAALGLMGLVWLLTLLVVTDRRQLELNVHAMADAVAEGKKEILLKHLAKDFAFQGQQREVLAESAIQAAKQHQVYDIHIFGFDVEELHEQTAKVYFRASAHARKVDRPDIVGCRGFFIKENGQWKLKELRLYNPVVDQPLALPF